MKIRQITENIWDARPQPKPTKSDIRTIVRSAPNPQAYQIDPREIELGMKYETTVHFTKERIRELVLNNLQSDPHYYSKRNYVAANSAS